LTVKAVHGEEDYAPHTFIDVDEGREPSTQQIADLLAGAAAAKKRREKWMLEEKLVRKRGSKSKEGSTGRGKKSKVLLNPFPFFNADKVQVT
jgi:hypothetical protein